MTQADYIFHNICSETIAGIFLVTSYWANKAVTQIDYLWDRC